MSIALKIRNDTLVLLCAARRRDLFVVNYVVGTHEALLSGR